MIKASGTLHIAFIYNYKNLKKGAITLEALPPFLYSHF